MAPGNGAIADGRLPGSAQARTTSAALLPSARPGTRTAAKRLHADGPRCSHCTHKFFLFFARTFARAQFSIPSGLRSYVYWSTANLRLRPRRRLSLLGGLAGGWSSLGRCGEHPPTLQPKAARRHRTRPPYQGEAPAMTKPMPAGRPQPTFFFGTKKQFVSTAARSALCREHHAQRIGRRLGPIGSASAKTRSRGGSCRARTRTS